MCVFVGMSCGAKTRIPPLAPKTLSSVSIVSQYIPKCGAMTRI